MARSKRPRPTDKRPNGSVPNGSEIIRMPATAASGPANTPRYPDGVGDPNCPHCYGLGYLRDDVPLGHPNFGRLQPCVCQIENMSMLQADNLRRKSNIESLTGTTFETFLPEGHSPDPAVRALLRAAYESCRAFVEDPEKFQNKWLLITGSYGCGKTHLAAAIANHCLAHGTPVLFINTPDLLDHLRAGFAPDADGSYSDRFDELRSVSVLVLDDLGTESPTPWATEKLYQLLNYRYNAKMLTVITTNKDLKDIDPRVASRLLDLDVVKDIRLPVPDFRAGKANLTAEVSTLGIHSHKTFDTFDPRHDLAGEARQTFLDAIRAARTYAEEPDGWFVLTGPYGSGKTHLAAAIANFRAQTGKQVVFVAYQDLTDLFRSTGHRDFDERNNSKLQLVRNTHLVVIDDISPQVSTPGFFREKFFQIFNYRFDAQLPTVLTTAADEKELDPRIKSRIFDSDMCQVHLLRAPSYRGKSTRRQQRR